MFKRVLNGVRLIAAEVIQFPTGEELEERKKKALDPERRRSRNKRIERDREKRERQDRNRKIVDDLKRDKD